MGVFLAVAPSAGNAALPSSQDLFAEMTPLSNKQLSDLRGGMVFGGLKFDFAVTIMSQAQKMIEDTMGQVTKEFGLTTQLKFDKNGQVTSVNNTWTGTPDNVTLPSVGQTGNVEASIGDTDTQLIHRLAMNHLTTITKNQSSSTQISQSAQLDLTAENFKQLSQQFKSSSFASQIGRISGMSALGN